MPNINIRILEGTSYEQKKKIVDDVCSAVARDFQLKTGRRIATEFIDIPLKHLAKGGEILGDKPLSAYVIISAQPRDQSEDAVKHVTEVIAENLGCPLDEVIVEYVDLTPGRIAHGAEIAEIPEPPSNS
jgi:phenylpyruvate tautomerase PptA (4-oxalocrotonate tautomerase family)